MSNNANNPNFYQPPSYPSPDQQQNYNQQQQPYNAYAPNDQEKWGSGAPNAQEGQSFDDAFKIEKKRWNDLWALIFFLLTLGGFIAVAAIVIRAWSQNYSFQGSGIYNSSNSFSLNSSTVILFSFVIVISMVLAFLYFCLARMFPKAFIIASLVLNIVIGLATCIYYFTRHYYSAAIVFLVFTLISAFCYWTMRSRIPFARIILEIIIDVTRANPSVLILSLIGCIISAVFSALFSVVVVTTYMKFDPNENNPGCSTSGGNCSQAKLIGVLVFVFFAGYYISEVIKNIIHVSIAGVYGSWYYLSKSDQGMPRHPAFGAFKRAITTSLGSICFGSLIVTFVQLLKQLLSALRQSSQNNGDMLTTFIFCCLECFVSLIDWLLEFFNHYAYCYIALYGKAYIPSAKDTWQLMKQKGIDAMVNDCLINSVLGMGGLFVSYVSALFAYLYLHYTNPSYNSSGNYYAPVIAFTFLISLQITNITTVPIQSGVGTFFVALARDPEVFRLSYPERFEEIMEAYPNVRDRLNIRD